ncbi:MULTISPECIES: hypothetical protein [Methylobacterium]|uniref:hypothetical protein n=1 Tax=Methylobacterium TaxID=407 RepID=UPI0009EAAD4F|nr:MULTISPECIES: hypothetical protein [Methylobacterium]
MTKLAALTAAALVALGTFGSPAAQARGSGGAIAAGVIGGLAAGALLGAAVSEAHAAPGYGYGYGRPAPAYGYEEEAPVVRYRPAPVMHSYEYDEPPGYRSPRAVRAYDDDFGHYGYRRAGYGYRRDCDRPHWRGGW